MKNLKMFKKLVIVMLSLVLVVAFSGKVSAVDDDLFVSVNSTGNTAANTSGENTAGGNTTNEGTAANNTANNTATNGSLTTNTTNNTTRNTATNNTTNATNNTTNRNVSNTLAKTGLSNTGSMIALVLVVCGISAIYSYKKVNDYKKL